METKKPELNYAKLKNYRDIEHLDREIRFTEVYKASQDAHPWHREIACLRVQVPDSLTPVQEGDYFAGRLDRATVGIDQERGDLDAAAYHIQKTLLKQNLENPDVSRELKTQIQLLLDFWLEEETYRACRNAYDPDIQTGIPCDDYYLAEEPSYPMYGLGGPCLDFDKLIQLGVEGLHEEIDNRKKRLSDDETEAAIFLDCLKDSLDIFSEAAHTYAAQAREMAGKNDAFKNRYELIADSCEHIAYKKPISYHQAIQLLWLYCLVARIRNYGRLDLILGQYYTEDIDQGHLSEAEAFEMTVGFWKLIGARGDHFNNRILIGGRDTQGNEPALRWAMLALRVQEEVNFAIPQLSLRCHKGMNEALWIRGMEVIGKGSTFPIIYNDDVNIPAVAKAFGVSEKEAEDYAMYGCGEYVLNHRSIGSPDAAFNAAKCLNMTLRNGANALTGQQRGLSCGHLSDFKTFEELQTAFKKQVHWQMNLLARAQDTIYRTTGEIAAFPYCSLLYDACIERAKPLLAGGVEYRGGTNETFGNNTAADSLLAIKELIYDKKEITADELIAAMDADWKGHEKLQARCLRIAKYGNDIDEADQMSLWTNEMICKASSEAGAKTDLDSFLCVLVNNGDSVTFGKGTLATPDGRKTGSPLSNGNQPGVGYDTQGLTALLNSMSKLDPSIHAGATHNVKLSREHFEPEKINKIGSIFKAYFAGGGTQAMITVSDRRELEKALENPEAYSNLIVRVGGYSERFIDLPRDIQMEVVRRTLFE